VQKNSPFLFLVVIAGLSFASPKSYAAEQNLECQKAQKALEDPSFLKDYKKFESTFYGDPRHLELEKEYPFHKSYADALRQYQLAHLDKSGKENGAGFGDAVYIQEFKNIMNQEQDWVYVGERKGRAHEIVYERQLAPPNNNIVIVRKLSLIDLDVFVEGEWRFSDRSDEEKTYKYAWAQTEKPYGNYVGSPHLVEGDFKYQESFDDGENTYATTVDLITESHIEIAQDGRYDWQFHNMSHSYPSMSAILMATRDPLGDKMKSCFNTLLAKEAKLYQSQSPDLLEGLPERAQYHLYRYGGSTIIRFCKSAASCTEAEDAAYVNFRKQAEKTIAASIGGAK